MAEFTNTLCSICDSAITSDIEAEFCSSCGQPIHSHCLCPSVVENHCMRCGAKKTSRAAKVASHAAPKFRSLTKKFSLIHHLFSFKGRISRLSYFLHNIVEFVFFFAFFLVLEEFPGKVQVSLLLGALAFAGWAESTVTVRRFHDLGKSGLYLFLLVIPLVNLFWTLVLTFGRGTIGPNRYGPDPRFAEDDQPQPQPQQVSTPQPAPPRPSFGRITVAGVVVVFLLFVGFTAFRAPRNVRAWDRVQSPSEVTEKTQAKIRRLELLLPNERLGWVHTESQEAMAPMYLFTDRRFIAYTPDNAADPELPIPFALITDLTVSNHREAEIALTLTDESTLSIALNSGPRISDFCNALQSNYDHYHLITAKRQMVQEMRVHAERRERSFRKWQVEPYRVGIERRRYGCYFAAEEAFELAQHYQSLAIEALTTAPNSEPTILAIAIDELGSIHELAKDWQQAADAYAKALPYQKEVLGDDSIEVAHCVDYLADLLSDHGDYQSAIPYYKNAIDRFEQLHRPGAQAETLWEMGAALLALGQLEEARKSLLQAQDLCENSPKIPPIVLINTLTTVAEVENMAGQTGQARATANRAIEAAEEHLDPAIVEIFRDKLGELLENH